MGKRILVVDDSKSIRDILRHVLQNRGYEVAEAADGREALRLTEAGGFDLILLDAILPQLGGIQVCEILKKDVRLRSVPVVVLSGMAKDLTSSARMLADAFIAKPFRMPELLACVEGLLEKG